MERKGQGTFEYVLLLGGVLLIVVLAIVLLRGGLFQSASGNIDKNACITALATTPQCVNSTGDWQNTTSVAISAKCVTALGADAPYSCAAGQCKCGPSPLGN